MPQPNPHPAKLRDLAAAPDRREAVAEATVALRTGAAVILPTETVYSIAVAATSPLAETIGRGLLARSSFLAWHPASADQATEELALQAAAQRRLVARLAPGPAIFVLEQSRDHLNETAKRLGCEPSALDPGSRGELAYRRSAHPVAREIIEQAAVPILLGELPVSGAKPEWATEAGEANEAAADLLHQSGAGEPLTLDEGTLRPGKPATVIRFSADPGGAWSIQRAGAYEERFVRKQLRRSILFVCTGNTCRSPMAEAIASDLLAQAEKQADSPAGVLPTTVLSAGTGAVSGAPPTPEALAALRQLGITPDLRGSRPLTRQLIAEADVIFAMSRSHMQSILAFDPTAAAKTVLLDPEGGDVPDPIGYPQNVYSETAARLRELIEARLKELDE